MSLFENIAEEIARRISRGIYLPGGKIPSIRELAGEFGCNKITMKKAFDVLKSKGLIENSVGSGSYVRYPEYLPEPAAAYDFKNAYISPELFPHKSFVDIFSRIMDRDGSSAFAQPPVKGMPGFLESAAGFYNVSRENMIIVSGAQQGMDIGKKALGNPSLPVILEDPTYPGAASLFRPSVSVPMEEDGPDMDKFAKTAAEFKGTLFYTMPAVHNPTGIAYSAEKIKIAAEIITENNLYVMEDDYDSEFNEKKTMRFIDIIPSRTIYVKSLSKTLASGIRLGFIVCPDELFEPALLAKYKTDIATSGLSQRLVDEFIRCGEYSSFIDRLGTEITGRRRLAFHMLEKKKGLSFSQKSSGYNIWVESSEAILPVSPPWSPGKRYSYSPGADRYFRISLMNISSGDFQPALDFLSSYLDAALN